MEVAGALKEQICSITDRFEGEPAEKKQKIEAEAVLLPCPTSDSEDAEEDSEEDSEDSGYEEHSFRLTDSLVNLSMPDILFAIEENNKSQDNTKYELVQLVKMNMTFDGEIVYYFTLKVKEKDDPDKEPVICRAAVSALISGERSLVEFYHDPQADECLLYRTRTDSASRSLLSCVAVGSKPFPL